MANFEVAIGPLLRREGGYVNNPNDSGGETNFGISKRSYPTLDIKNLTIAQAKQIYKQDYWNKVQGDFITDQKLAEHLFDMAVNHGVNQGIKLAQKGLNDIGFDLAADGVLGPKTLDSLIKADSSKLNTAIVEQRIKFYKDLVRRKPSQKEFLEGWLKRANEFLGENKETGFFITAGILSYLLYNHLKRGK